MAPIEVVAPDSRISRRPVRVRPGDYGMLPRSQGPRPSRPACAPPRYRGTGVAISAAPHRRRPVTPATTVALALLAAVITVWLGLVAHFGAMVGASAGMPARMPDRLGVVRVQTGETLDHLAARVAPDAPVRQVAERIRELNDLNSAALTAGQTVIAPVG
jgi:hypothetical protein